MNYFKFIRDLLNELEDLDWCEMKDLDATSRHEVVLLEDIYDFIEKKRMELLHTEPEEWNHFDMEVKE